MNSESEFGTVLAHTEKGRIIQTDDGNIVFFAQAFTPFTSEDLEWLAHTINMAKESAPTQA